MIQYLIDFIKYNLWANQKMIESVGQIPDKQEACKLISHIITSQNRWMNRITKEVDDTKHEWFGDVYNYDQIGEMLDQSVSNWLTYLEGIDESSFDKEIIYQRSGDGKTFSATLRDIVLQINYHSIHHRAQVYRIIRQQGGVPPTTDYIILKLKEV
jgi:uncharacterized damage-inducible protein DinB